MIKDIMTRTLYQQLRSQLSFLLAIGVVCTLWLAMSSFAAAQTIEGQVMGAGAPIARSAVTLSSASPSAPKQLAQTQAGDDGRFTLSLAGTGGPEEILYIVAKGGQPTAHKASGDNPAIVLLSVLGNKPSAHVTVNEFTTIASVWTTNQFINGGQGVTVFFGMAKPVKAPQIGPAQQP